MILLPLDQTLLVQKVLSFLSKSITIILFTTIPFHWRDQSRLFCTGWELGTTDLMPTCTASQMPSQITLFFWKVELCMKDTIARSSLSLPLASALSATGFSLNTNGSTSLTDSPGVLHLFLITVSLSSFDHDWLESQHHFLHKLQHFPLIQLQQHLLAQFLFHPAFFFMMKKRNQANSFSFSCGKNSKSDHSESNTSSCTILGLQWNFQCLISMQQQLTDSNKDRQTAIV